MSTPHSYKKRRWLLADPADSTVVAQLSRVLKVPPLVASLLVGRGFGNADAGRAFLNPEFKALHEPALLPNIDAAVERIVAAINAGEPIVLFGDYDVDGITGTAMLWRLLTAAGAKVTTYIPHRVDEGYGISIPAMQTILDGGAKLIVSIDCGVTAIEPIKHAVARGVDVIVTDHHEIGAVLPPAVAIVHPRLEGSRYPNPDLCGAGVAFKLAWALASRLCGGGKVSDAYRALLLEFTAFAALATIADVVPLTGENRILARYGLNHLPRVTNPGIQALIAASGCGEKKINCTTVGFTLAPRLNAAGRMEHANLAVELFTTADGPRAQEIAEYLEEQNRDRQATERKMAEESVKHVEAVIEREGLPTVIVVCDEKHHAGVVGIVASRLVEKYNRPTFVLACDGEKAYGSARSITGFELHHAIDACRHLLISGGGHAMAGGVKMRLADLEAFKMCVNDYAATILEDEHLIPSTAVDAELTLRDCTIALLHDIERFEPFGRGNPRPRFVIRRAKITAAPRRVGSTGSHMQLQIKQDGHAARGIAFKMGDAAPALEVGLEIDLVVEPKIDEFNGQVRVDLMIIDIARSDGMPLEIPAAAVHA